MLWEVLCKVGGTILGGIVVESFADPQYQTSIQKDILERGIMEATSTLTKRNGSVSSERWRLSV